MYILHSFSASAAKWQVDFFRHQDEQVSRIVSIEEHISIIIRSSISYTTYQICWHFHGDNDWLQKPDDRNFRGL